ncbi:MAG TPA: hypothetical protein VIG47_08040, partial [Gemmatimonadaceae bacterium]
WYNQSTEQVYHLSTDNSFPYWVYATQQDAGAIRTKARGDLGAITPLDWRPVNGWEWGTIIADPLDTNIAYNTGYGIIKINHAGEQWINVSPTTDPASKLRAGQSQPEIWAPWNQHQLIVGFQSLVSTTDGGAHWTSMSPDLTVTGGADSAANAAPNGRRAAIESMSASTVTPGMIWVSTTNGRIALTRNSGKSWSDVSIAALPNPARAEILTIDASHHDAGSAYAAVSYSRAGDYTPYFFRTRDYGRTWAKIVDGLPVNQPSGSFARVIRADTKKAGLLFAGTESGMYVSFDDGDHWQSLRQNLPATSIRDLVVKDSDLVIATHGRSFWILDDITPLRQLTPNVAAEPAHLFAPAAAFRVHRDTYTDTPMPPEEPVGQNPPDGAIIDYYVGSAATGSVTLDILDAAGHVVRRFTSNDRPEVTEQQIDALNVPAYWIRRPRILSATTGMHRWIWNLHYADPNVLTHEYPISAIYMVTPRLPLGPAALPGTYTIRLTVNGKSYTQPLVVKMDPRVHTPVVDLQEQFALATHVAAMIERDFDAIAEARALRSGLDTAKAHAADATTVAMIDTVEAHVEALRITRVN